MAHESFLRKVNAALRGHCDNALQLIWHDGRMRSFRDGVRLNIRPLVGLFILLPASGGWVDGPEAAGKDASRTTAAPAEMSSPLLFMREKPNIDTKDMI